MNNRKLLFSFTAGGMALLVGGALTINANQVQANGPDQHDGTSSATYLDSLRESGRETQFHPSQYYAGGKNGTVFNATSRAFEMPSPAIVKSRKLLQSFDIGEGIFESDFVVDPNSPNGGLGPVYNKNSCISCHPAYGRSRQQKKFSTEYGNGYIAFVHNPDGSIVDGYTFMLQTKAVPPHQPPAKGVDITWHQFVDKYGNQYPDGTPYNQGNEHEGTLVYPTASIVEPLIPLPDDAKVSIEATIGLFGTGLLDAIKDEDIIAEHEFQKELPGPIKGKTGRWIEETYDGKKHLGKFAWHNSRSSLQNGPGFNGIYNVFNVTRADRPHLYTTEKWIQAQEALGIDGTLLRAHQPIELSQEDRDHLMVWHRGLGVPAPRGLERPQVQRGNKVFHQVGCSRCHKPDWTTGEYPYIPAYSNQRIWPYTDLLMHDMGKENAGRYRTYRTPPLWGRGLMYNAVDHTDMFHDLRARNFEEAILWHFGEAKGSREMFRRLSKQDREALIAFLNAL